MNSRDDALIQEGTIELAPSVRISAAALRLRFSRSSGPGGQNVNKLNTKAELWVSLEDLASIGEPALRRLRALAGRRLTRDGEIHLSSEAQRTQEQNRRAVLDRLRGLIVAAIREPRPRKKTRPTRAARQRRLESKRHRSRIKSQRRGTDDA